MKLKTIAITVGSVLLLGSLFAKNKVNQVTSIIENLKFKLAKINDLKFSGKNIILNLDLLLINPTPESFSINTGNAIQLHKIEVFTNTGQKLAEAFKHVNDINLHANGQMLVSNVDIIILTNNLGSTVINLLTKSPNKLVTKAHVTIYGKPYII